MTSLEYLLQRGTRRLQEPMALERNTITPISGRSKLRFHGAAQRPPMWLMMKAGLAEDSSAEESYLPTTVRGRGEGTVLTLAPNYSNFPACHVSLPEHRTLPVAGTL